MSTSFYSYSKCELYLSFYPHCIKKFTYRFMSTCKKFSISVSNFTTGGIQEFFGSYFSAYFNIDISKKLHNFLPKCLKNVCRLIEKRNHSENMDSFKSRIL